MPWIHPRYKIPKYSVVRVAPGSVAAQAKPYLVHTNLVCYGYTVDDGDVVSCVCLSTWHCNKIEILPEHDLLVEVPSTLEILQDHVQRNSINAGPSLGLACVGILVALLSILLPRLL